MSKETFIAILEIAALMRLLANEQKKDTEGYVQDVPPQG